MAQATLVEGKADRETAPARLVTLDGLRGLAALVVVVHHSVLSWRPLAAQYFGADRTSGSWWLTFTPLHLVWAGGEAVMVFFVLSGLVLSLPFLDRGGLARWRGYFGQRLIRLYVPVVGALASAAVLVETFPRTPGPTTSWWFDAHAVHVDAHTLATDVQLLHGVSWIDASLWSLRYEVLFSLLLPVYVLVARRFGRRSGWLVVPLLLLAGAGVHENNATLGWLPVFGIGVVMAATRRELTAFGARISASRWSGPLWAVVGAISVLLLLAEWWARGLGQITPLPLALARCLGVVGAGMIVLMAMVCPAFGALCTWRPVRWLGTVSFSLYLVHEPILVSVSSLVGGARRGVAVTLVVGLLLSLLAAAAFQRWVELPSQRVAGAVKRRLQGTTRPAGEAVGPRVHVDAAEHGHRSPVPPRSRSAVATRPVSPRPRVAAETRSSLRPPLAPGAPTRPVSAQRGPGGAPQLPLSRSGPARTAVDAARGRVVPAGTSGRAG
jgi:peptidoglycan/LPS O-acetylase OafA/YrhL